MHKIKSKQTKKLETSNVGENEDQLKHYEWEIKIIQSLGKTVQQFLLKANIHLPYAPAILFLAIYPKSMNLRSDNNLHTGKFIAALFISAKRGHI